MTALIPSLYQGREVRSVLDERGEPWFVAKDVCAILGIANANDAVGRLADDERRGVGITDPLGGKQTATAVNEAGLYRLIFSSRKEGAEAFKRWVCHEVLPAIRRTGGYQSAGKVSLPSLRDDTVAVVGLCELFGVVGNNALIRADQTMRRIHGVSPMALIGMDGLVNAGQQQQFTPTEMGKMLPGSPSGQAVNRMLAGLGFQARQDKFWLITDAGREHAVLLDTGKKHSDGTPVVQTKWKRSALDALLHESAAPA